MIQTQHESKYTYTQQQSNETHNYEMSIKLHTYEMHKNTTLLLNYIRHNNWTQKSGSILMTLLSCIQESYIITQNQLQLKNYNTAVWTHSQRRKSIKNTQHHRDWRATKCATSVHRDNSVTVSTVAAEPRVMATRYQPSDARACSVRRKPTRHSRSSAALLTVIKSLLEVADFRHPSLCRR